MLLGVATNLPVDLRRMPDDCLRELFGVLVLLATLLNELSSLRNNSPVLRSYTLPSFTPKGTLFHVVAYMSTKLLLALLLY